MQQVPKLTALFDPLQLADKLPECMRYTKQQLNFWRDFSWSMTIGHARDWLAIHNLSPETKQAVSRFVEKRKQ